MTAEAKSFKERGNDYFGRGQLDELSTNTVTLTVTLTLIS